MANPGPATLLTALALAAAAGPSWAQPERPEAIESDQAPARTTFKCEGGGDLTAQFASRDARLVAIVDAGDGPHALPIRPWTEGPAKLTWTDGRRTLTWSPGVQIMWMDGASHRACGRAEHRH